MQHTFKEVCSLKINKIRKTLFALQDLKYRNFQSGLIPDMSKDAFIGVRTPDLRKLARDMAKDEDVTVFLSDVPHKYFD